MRVVDGFEKWFQAEVIRVLQKENINATIQGKIDQYCSTPAQVASGLQFGVGTHNLGWTGNRVETSPANSLFFGFPTFQSVSQISTNEPNLSFLEGRFYAPLTPVTRGKI
jgi:hypothetical protein